MKAMSYVLQHGIVDALLSNLRHIPSQSLTGAINEGPAKSILLTLHGLFPTTFLPALDVLDRNLVTRMILDSHTEISEVGIIMDAHSQQISNGKLPERCVYYVRSNAPSYPTRGRFSDRLGGDDTSYEVRTSVWNCTCAAFTFAAVNAAQATYCPGELFRPSEETAEPTVFDQPLGQWGGHYKSGKDQDVPICKHIFACLLAENWTVAKGLVEEKCVSREEMAGWAARI